jgi:hypothetical protein
MKNEAKLMKNLHSSDINTMVLPAMKDAALCLSMPVSTAVIWGIHVSPSVNTAIWGTLAIGGGSRRQDFSAIWGTAGIWTPFQPAVKTLPAMDVRN